MALACMFFSALIIVFQRYLREVHFSLVSLSSGIWGVLQCTVLAFTFGVFELPDQNSDPKVIIYLSGLAFLTFFAQSFIVLALKFEQAGPVSITQSCDVIFAFMWQFVFLSVIPDYFR
jgi:drug/metabolite transporter (DMT)-like permease